MILLKTLLAEINLSAVQPYTTQHVWRDKWNDAESFETQFQADGQTIQMTMNHYTRSQFSDSGEWQFAFFAQDRETADRNAARHNWTTSAALSAATGQVDTFRLFKTVGLAIRDFADTHPGVDVVDITGGDINTDKEQQKSRIYARFLQTNPDLSDFRVELGSTKLFLVRKNMDRAQPDASGIDTPGDPGM
jgi:hypothetical protein